MKTSTGKIKRTHIQKEFNASGCDQLIKQEEREIGNPDFKPYMLYLNQNNQFWLFPIERDEDHGSPEDDDDGSENEVDNTDGSDAGSNLYKDEDDSLGIYWEVKLNRLDLLSC